MRNLLFPLALGLVMTLSAQNPSSYTAERTDNTAASLNLKNTVGFWHLSGPRAYETNNKLSLFWNDGSYHRILSVNDNGTVGVGVSNPLSKLHVYNGSSGHSPHGYSDLSIEDTDHVMLSLMTYNTKSAFYGFADTDDDFVGGIQYDHPDDIMRFRVNNRSADMVLNKDGRLGIGTTSPQHKLDVKGVIATTHDNGHKMVVLTSGDGNSYLNFTGGSSTSRIGFQVDGSSRMSIMNNGSVGIGTTNTSTYKLAVNGNIRAKEIKVETNWADYVFKEGYDLPTLEEVESHIKEKGHLINIPSAMEVEENGILLGEMNKLLLEKIEELTLYTLQQEREIKGQKAAIENMSKQLEAMQNQINNLKN